MVRGREHNQRGVSVEQNNNKPKLPMRIVHTVFDTRVGVVIGGGLVTATKVLEQIETSSSLHPMEIALEGIGVFLAAVAGYEVRNGNRKDKS